MSGLSKSETEELARSLELQGCRLERPSGSGGYPIRVFFPDDAGTTVLHGSVTDKNAVTIKRTEVRRAGLTWPFDDRRATKRLHKQLRQEQGTMSTATTTAPRLSREELNPLGHVRFPPGAKDFPTPMESSARPVMDALKSMHGTTFWTDQVYSVLTMRDVPGYKGNAGMQRLQGMLDFLGYRVVETKRNRNGYSYRWEQVPNYEVPPFADRTAQAKAAAIAKAAKRSTASVTPISRPKLPEPPKVVMPRVEFPTPVPSPTVEHRKALHEGRVDEPKAEAPKAAEPEVVVVESVHPDTSVARAEAEAAMAMAEQAEAEANRLKAEVETWRNRALEAERNYESDHRELEKADAEAKRLRDALHAAEADLDAVAQRPVESPDVWPLDFGQLVGGGQEPMTLDNLEAVLRAMGLEAMLRRK